MDLFITPQEQGSSHNSQILKHTQDWKLNKYCKPRNGELKVFEERGGKLHLLFKNVHVFLKLDTYGGLRYERAEG